MAASSFNDLLKKTETTLDEYFGKKAPALPENVKDIIVKITPWANLIIFVLTLPAVLAIFSIGTLFSPLAVVGGPETSVGYFLALAFLVAGEILWGLAIPGLFKQTRRSWQYLFWGQLLNCVYNLLTLNIISLIIGAAIGFYFLFQIRDRFTN